jgi:hypothetical protein
MMPADIGKDSIQNFVSTFRRAGPENIPWIELWSCLGKSGRHSFADSLYEQRFIIANELGGWRS